ncbi:Transcription initiation factor IIB-1 [Morella rubra]|uniref:Transcription initiation factor IIB-1 n=1 Tax=Morella rubra TaxID=262757 RepID=A0A6A1WDT3_9ROSI|nr:Transcription initiation factor IIB-1 [Morella rubra]
MSSSSRGCTSCRSNSLVRDDITGNLICATCGIVQEFDNFDAQLGGLNGPQGTFVRVGTAGTGTLYSYKEKKVFEAQKLIDYFTSRLGLSGPISNDVKTMIARITDEEFGQGDWFPILIGACAYVVMRKDNKSLPIAEVASVIGTDIYELGRMVARVVDFLGLKGPQEFPEFDVVGSFERAVRTSLSFSRLGRDKVERIRKQGVFLVQCAVKWFLTTGRRPLPVVAAVLVLVGELNGVDTRIEDVAREVHANVSTSRLRYRELLESLVEVAQALPWGKDVTLKNVVKNAPFVIQYMERKSMAKPIDMTRATKESEVVGVDLGDVISECLRKDVEYGIDVNSRENDSQYFEAGHEKSMEGSGEVRGRKRKRGFELHACRDWWNGKSELTKKLLLRQILEKDVGLDALPPSFVSGCRVYKRRRKKINAAKLRIKRVMDPSGPDLIESIDICSSEDARAVKKRNRKRVSDVDWEDLIIETLLLHEVREEEIEKGHYNTLLEVHVFNGGVMPEVPATKAK